MRYLPYQDDEQVYLTKCPVCATLSLPELKTQSLGWQNYKVTAEYFTKSETEEEG